MHLKKQTNKQTKNETPDYYSSSQDHEDDNLV